VEGSYGRHDTRQDYDKIYAGPEPLVLHCQGRFPCILALCHCTGRRCHLGEGIDDRWSHEGCRMLEELVVVSCRKGRDLSL